MNKSQSDALVFFGATGDLAFKMIFPALLAMVKRGDLDVPVIGVGRSGWTDEQLRKTPFPPPSGPAHRLFQGPPRKSKFLAAGAATATVQWSSDLGTGDPWTSNFAAVPDTTQTVNGLDFQISPNGTLNDIIVTIPSTEATDGKLFGRVSGTEN